MLLAWKTTFFRFRVNDDVVHAEFEVLELREHFGEGVTKTFHGHYQLSFGSKCEKLFLVVLL